MPSFLKKRVNRVDYLRQHLGDFAHNNRELLIIVADPETDQMFVAYKDKMILGKIKSVEGNAMTVVRDVLRNSKLKTDFDRAVDFFVAGMVDLLHLSVDRGKEFYKFIADCLFHFQPKAGAWLRDQEKKKEILAAGGAISPIQPVRSSLQAKE